MNTPMLLTEVDFSLLRYPCWAERKVDGFRCVICVVGSTPVAYSRQMNPIHAATELAKLVGDNANCGFYDGELAASTWSKTASAVKRGTALGLVFHAFDHIVLSEWRNGGSERPLEARRTGLEALAGLPGIEVVVPELISCEAELEAAFARAMDLKWEGLVVKQAGSLYTCGTRSRDWMKVKPAGAS